MDVDQEFDQAIVARLRTGDSSAFDVVYRAYHAHLFNFLARLSRRREVAEDLVEETWLRLVASAPQLRDDTRLGPWLFTVARNLYRSYCRSRLVEASHAADLISLWPGGTPAFTPFDVAAASEAERRVEAALAGLPVTYREVLLLVCVEGFTPAEAAAACGITPEAMRQRLSRARNLLAERLQRIPAMPARLQEVMW